MSDGVGYAGNRLRRDGVEYAGNRLRREEVRLFRIPISHRKSAFPQI